MCMVRYQPDIDIVSKLNSIHVTRCDNFSCVTHFDLSNYRYSFHSGHLEQAALACPNLQIMNLQNCLQCLKSLQGLQAIASHCQNLQGLNLLSVHVSLVEDHILFWEILRDMKLTHLAVDFSVLTSKAAKKEKLMWIYQKCWTIRAIQIGYCRRDDITNGYTLMLSYFPLLNYCYVSPHLAPLTVIHVQDVINNCKELRCASFYYNHCYSLSLSVTHHYNLQQLYIDSPHTDVPEDFMTSVSAHGGLVHVIMMVRSLTAEGITSLVMNSPKLIKLCFNLNRSVVFIVMNCNTELRKKFRHRKLIYTACLVT